MGDPRAFNVAANSTTNQAAYGPKDVEPVDEAATAKQIRASHFTLGKILLIGVLDISLAMDSRTGNFQTTSGATYQARHAEVNDGKVSFYAQEDHINLGDRGMCTTANDLLSLFIKRLVFINVYHNVEDCILCGFVFLMTSVHQPIAEAKTTNQTTFNNKRADIAVNSEKERLWLRSTHFKMGDSSGRYITTSGMLL